MFIFAGPWKHQMCTSYMSIDMQEPCTVLYARCQSSSSPGHIRSLFVYSASSTVYVTRTTSFTSPDDLEGIHAQMSYLYLLVPSNKLYGVTRSIGRRQDIALTDRRVMSRKGSQRLRLISLGRGRPWPAYLVHGGAKEEAPTRLPLPPPDLLS